MYGSGMGTNRPTFEENTVAEIRRLIEAEPGLSRTALSRRLCERFGWRAPNGTPREMSCRLGLNRLEREGRIRLPPPRRRMPTKRYRRRNDRRTYRMPEPVIVSPAKLGELSLVRVTAEDSELSARWHELTARHHYLGAGPLCGRQLRYLVRSERFGWVATLAFTSAALYLEARDEWIGWDCEARRLHLGQAVCNARFLILPWIEVHNLASKILGLCPRRVGRDWLAAYGVEPVLLETFVDPKRFRGTCYLAAGWECVGETKGRGRQDRDKARPVRPKRVFVLPLRADFRDILRETPPKPPEPVYYREADERPWEQVEFASVDLGDARRGKRLARLAAAFFEKPTADIPEACGSAAAARAAYRFLKHDRTTMKAILAPHYEATAGRVAAEGGVVLAAQDTTFLNYSAHPATEGLGPIGSTENGPVGIVLHDTMAFTAEGTPLGLVDIQCRARDPEEFGLGSFKKNLPIEYKESIKWIDSWQAASALQKRVPQALVVSVGDREADFYELFERVAADPAGAKLLVRATHNRNLRDECLGLKDAIASRPVDDIIEVHIPRRGSKPARVIDMELRYGTVTLRAPSGHKGRPSPRMQFVHVVEQRPRGAGEPVEWYLLTNCAVENTEQAREKVQWYTKRWGIEIYHRIIKSGCRIEDRQLSTETRLENCLAIDLVVAWRVFHLTMLGRECPDLPADVCLDELEWKVLAAKYAGEVPVEPPTLRQAVIWLGRLGGYIARPKDYLPGVVTIWRGLITLLSMVQGWRLAIALGMPNGP